MLNDKPLTVLPQDIQRDWLAQLRPSEPTDEGIFQLVDIRRTDPAGWQGQRITVLVVDENGRGMPGVNVAFAYSTATPYILVNPKWLPPLPQRAFIVATEGNGQIDQIQGSPVKPGEPGGVTVYIFELQHYASDVVSGCGMLADHTGLHLTFRLQRPGVMSLDDTLTNIENRLAALEFEQFG